MAACFCDWDGTFAEWGSESPLSGAVDELRRFQAAGHQIIFTTQRKPNDPSFDMVAMRALVSLYFPDAVILHGITSPRIVINDAGAIAINHPRDGAWNYDLRALAGEK